MKKLALVFVCILLSACGTGESQSATYTGEVETFEYKFEDKGLSLLAEIEVSQDIKVKATLKNISGNTITYNGRCGIPFYINMEMEGTSVNLSSDRKLVMCEDIFDPNDLEDFKSGDTMEKTVGFSRDFFIFNDGKTPAHDGHYNIQFGFTTYDHGHFYTEYMINLTHDSEPEILTHTEAKEKALENDEVNKWYEERIEKNLEVKAEKPFLSSGNWHLAFHSIDKKEVYRIVVAVNYNTGDITNIFREQFTLMEGEEYLFED